MHGASHIKTETFVTYNYYNQFNNSLSRTYFQLNIPLSLLMALFAEAHLAGQLRHLRSALKKYNLRYFDLTQEGRMFAKG